jgi:alpha-D-ribose 1-methylphosphonate 5-triphosphate synthase subunit PhnI
MEMLLLTLKPLRVPARFARHRLGGDRPIPAVTLWQIVLSLNLGNHRYQAARALDDRALAV